MRPGVDSQLARAPCLLLAGTQPEIRAGPLAAVVSVQGIDEVSGLLLERDRPPSVRGRRPYPCLQRHRRCQVQSGRIGHSDPIVDAVERECAAVLARCRPGRARDRARMTPARDVREGGAAAGVEGVRGDEGRRCRRGGERRGVCRRARWCDDRVGLSTPVGPGREPVRRTAHGLWRDRADTVRRADDDGPAERRRRRCGADDELQPGRARGEVERHRLRVESQRLHVREPAGVGRGQAELQIGRVLVVRRRERAAGDARERLDGVLMTVGRTVLHHELPAQRARRQRSLLWVGRGAGERDDIPDAPGRP